MKRQVCLPTENSGGRLPKIQQRQTVAGHSNTHKHQERKNDIMNSKISIPSSAETALYRTEFFRLPTPGKRDPHFGLSRGWYYKAAAAGEIKLVAIRQRGALRGVRLIAYDSVVDYIHRSMCKATATAAPQTKLPLETTKPTTPGSASLPQSGEARG